MFILLTLIPTSLELKNTNSIASQISSLEDRLVVMRNQLNSLNDLSNDVHNENWICTFFDDNPKDIEGELDELIKIIGRYNTRNNMLLGMAINIFLAWDIRQRLTLVNWITKNHMKWNNWEKGLAKIEAYISAATIRFNYSNTIYGQVSEDGERLMEGLIHPLLAHIASVQNDFSLNTEQQFLILTGPNMAGKSTYLRAIGCAILFANAGFPVFASKYSYPRVQLYTSMRTSDNLTENSSYFFAELSRLRKLMDAVEQNNSTVFVLLDEILKGTNSKDKEEGSYMFMEKMQRLGAEGVIATHDLSLCRLETQNKAFFIGHFDSTILSEELTFDYLLKKGVCQNMNASFLLKKMKLVN
jgi:DNA mismatch repair ATPase MutS